MSELISEIQNSAKDISEKIEEGKVLDNSDLLNLLIINLIGEEFEKNE